MSNVALYLVTLVVFVAIDLLWLGVVAKSFYRAEIGPLLAPQTNLGAALAFYVIYAFGLMFFVIQPATLAGGWTKALLAGAVFGFVAYATYDLSNLATLRGWSIKLSAVDMLWGAALTGATCAIAVAAASRFGPT